MLKKKWLMITSELIDEKPRYTCGAFCFIIGPMKENPSILEELRDLIQEVDGCLADEDFETAWAFVEQFILLEHDGSFSAQSEVLDTKVWDVNAPTIMLDSKKVIYRSRMKAYTDPDFGKGAVMPLLPNTGVSLKDQPYAVLCYLDIGGCLTLRREKGALFAASHSSPDTLKGGADFTISVGVALSENHHGRLLGLPAEPFMIMATSKWIAAIPAEKDGFILKTFEGGQLIEY